MVNFDRCTGCCNTLDDHCDRLCIPNKTEDVNLNVFSMIARIHESKLLVKFTSCDSSCRMNSKKM